MKPTRLALIGAGRMGSTHAKALSRGLDGIELATVVEPCDEAVARLPAIARRYRDTSELLAAGGVDGAIVAVPTRLHAQVVEQLVEAGLPVLCEKPCGFTSDETRALARHADTAGVPLHVGYWRRFVPALRHLQGQLAAGELGEIELVHCAQWDERPPPAAFRHPASSGGIVVDMGVHELDQLRWLTGQEIVSASGASSTVSSDQPVEGDPESVAFAAALDGGAIALVSLVRRHPPGDLCRVEVVGTRGAARLDFMAPPTGEETLLEALREQTRDFAAAIRGAPSAGASPNDATKALEAAERARAALSLAPGERANRT
jgi:myo-inositol 2-dehydrogenase / D-chiro-inositol 1-dehydrogenase